MSKANAKKLESELATAQEKGVAHLLKDPIPVVANLDNGEVYKGLAFEVRPNGLVMIQTGKCELGVQLSIISCESPAKVAEADL